VNNIIKPLLWALVMGFVVFSRLLNAGTIFPIRFNADGTQTDPLIEFWHWMRKCKS